MNKIAALLLVALCNIVKLVSTTDTIHLNDLRYYERVEPLHIDRQGRVRRDLITRVDEHKHIEEPKFTFRGHNRDFTLKLNKNRLLIPPNFKAISQNKDGSRKMEWNLPIENCYYHGELEDRKGTTVTLSTCNGLRGLIQDEDGEEFFIEQHPIDRNSHILYNMKDLIVKNSTCGHTTSGMEEPIVTHDYISLKQELQDEIKKHSRKRRNAKHWNYIEVVTVIDNKEHIRWGNSVKVSQEKALELFNYVDILYKTMDTRVAVVSVIVWSTKDEIEVKSLPSALLREFSKYTVDVVHGELKINCDNTQLVSGIDFDGSIVGLAGVGNMCTRSSCAVNQAHSSNPVVVANTIAHELGHNLGFSHNTNQCTCPKTPCVMNAYVAGSQAKGFSSCTSKVFKRSEETGKYPCLLDYPSEVFGPSKCGDGYKEEGEECDCGSEEDCKALGVDICCNATTCLLHEEAKCADGGCCENCQFKSKGIECRGKVHSECDLEEYCTGTDSHCPRNYFVSDGKSCDTDQGYCYEGLCRIHTQQCEELWGPNGAKGRDKCFDLNTEGNDYGHCGENEAGKFIACSEKNAMCGKIQCQAKPGTTIPRFPLIGSNRAIKIVTFRISPTVNFKCKAIKMSFSEDLDDPTLTFDGTKCGKDAICLNHQCTNISAIPNNKKCDQECQNGGVCNNNGHCHCPVGFACPYCEKSGPGGSMDSGQGCLTSPPLPTALPVSGGSKLEYLALLAVIPLVGIIAVYCYRKRRNGKYADSRHSERFDTAMYPAEKGRENPGYDKPPTTPNQSLPTHSKQPTGPPKPQHQPPRPPLKPQQQPPKPPLKQQQQPPRPPLKPQQQPPRPPLKPQQQPPRPPLKPQQQPPRPLPPNTFANKKNPLLPPEKSFPVLYQ